MPIFVDHAGMNTLLNQNIDTTSNILDVGEQRFRPITVPDKAIATNDTANETYKYLYVGGLEGQFPTSSAQGGFTFSFWLKFNDGADLNAMKQIAVGTGNIEPTFPQTFQLEHRVEEIRFTVFSSSYDSSTAPNDYKRWIWDYEENLMFSWKHIFFTWDGQFNTTPRLFVNGSLQTSTSTLGSATGLVTRAVDVLTFFDHPIESTSQELQGAMQDFIIYDKYITTALSASTQYNSGTPAGDLISDQPLLYYKMGNEKELTSLSVNDTLNQSIFPTTNNLTSGVTGELIPKSTTLSIITGPQGTITTKTGSDGYVGYISDPQQLAALNTHRNGPYGYSSWKQLRSSHNPVSRYHQSNSELSFTIEPGIVRNVLPQGELRVRDRYSTIFNFKEPAVTQKAYPLVWNVGRHFKDEDGFVDLDNPQRFSILSSYGNQLVGFSNERVDKLLKFDPSEEITEYNSITEMYLENGLDKLDSPLTHWEFLYYRETVFPISKNQYRLETRNRPNFISFYRHKRTDRSKTIQTSSNVPFGFPENSNAYAQSTWPLDESEVFLTDQYRATNLNLEFFRKVRRKNGILMSTESTFSEEVVAEQSKINSAISSQITSAIDVIDNILAPYPIYARKTLLESTQSISNPSGLSIPQTGGLSNVTLFEGGALWEAGQKREIRNPDGTYSSSAKQPFYDTYENYVNDVRNYGKNYSVIPEFRMSTQVEDYIRTDGQIETDMFDVVGGATDQADSSKSQFFEIYSTTDFLKHFEVIKEDHKDFTNFDVIALRCKAIKKFLPYEGFYPCQRTVDLSKRFYDSFKNHIKLVNISGSELNGFNYGTSYVMDPLFRPGVLFNSIKSGVAVDYPIITGNSVIAGSDEDQFLLTGSFDKRIPFEALLEPQDHLIDYKLTSNIPHPSGNLKVGAQWDGMGDELYPLMANNFLAECINFFLPNGQLTSIVSKKQEDIVLEKDKVYGMRVRMRRSMSGSRGSVYHFNSSSFPYTPPQDVSNGSLKESFTMYSRPDAFGPPTFGQSGFAAAVSSLSTSSAQIHHFKVPGRVDEIITGSGGISFAYVKQDSRNGYNFPFTPPYYHGEGWCEIILTASSDSMTIKQIQDAATYTYKRYDSSFYLVTSSVKELLSSQINVQTGPQSFGPADKINNNAVQLSASLNIKGVGSITTNDSEAAAGSLVVDTGAQESNRWVIQTKFETPMLNFNHINHSSENITMPQYASESVPRGMWHQYGRIPEGDEGVFIQVNPIPENYQSQVLGKTIGEPSENNGIMEDLSEALGFSGLGTKVGRLALNKEISEAVVAVPFIESEGKRQFFKVDINKVNTFKQARNEGDNAAYNSLISGEPHQQIGRSLLNQMIKMEKFIFPPSFDFLRFDNVTPIAMYIFEFTHTLSQRDLQDIWQNLPPDIGSDFEVQEIAITHPLLKKELLGNGSQRGNTPIPLPERLRWMVFKVKQRAANNYFQKTVLRNSKVNQRVGRGNVTRDEFGLPDNIQFNWPYDFFSLVEMVRIDAEAEIGTVEQSEIDGYTDDIPDWKPKQASRDKIETVIGGIEDEPIIETEVPPEPTESSPEKFTGEVGQPMSGFARAQAAGIESFDQNYLQYEDVNGAWYAAGIEVYGNNAPFEDFYNTSRPLQDWWQEFLYEMREQYEPSPAATPSTAPQTAPQGTQASSVGFLGTIFTTQDSDEPEEGIIRDLDEGIREYWNRQYDDYMDGRNNNRINRAAGKALATSLTIASFTVLGASLTLINEIIEAIINQRNLD